MTTAFRAAALFALLSSASAFAEPADNVAWRITEDLTTEIGTRPAGSEAEARARDWAVPRLTALGFQNARIEPFTVTGFIRGAESARLTAPYPQQLAITALGYSVPTPKGGLTAPLVYFANLDALKAAPEGSLKGKVAFIDHNFAATQDGSGYGRSGRPGVRDQPSRQARARRASQFVRSAPTCTAIRIPGRSAGRPAWRRFRQVRSRSPTRC